jgi:hypothetical protein
LQSEENSWVAHVQLLPVVEDTLIFFLCLGLQRIIWKQWNVMSVESHEAILNSVISILVRTTSPLTLFARSKAELVLAAICQNSYSFEPTLKLLEIANQQNIFAGVSAMRTIIEEVFQVDPRISPPCRTVLIKEANNIALPITTLACQICISSIQSQSGSSPTLIAALLLLRAVVGKMDIGPHISPESLNLLFAIAELGAGAESSKEGSHGSGMASSFIDASVKAVNVLTELMARRYVPRATVAMAGSSSAAAVGKDVGADLLVDLVVKAINLLQKYRYAYFVLYYFLHPD